MQSYKSIRVRARSVASQRGDFSVEKQSCEKVQRRSIHHRGNPSRDEKFFESQLRNRQTTICYSESGVAAGRREKGVASVSSEFKMRERTIVYRVRILKNRRTILVE